ncbi:unnamed protein product [Moneuplotes crassus]|uniref:Uncharacterized protein n=1 Tax=Euplotes crassus TaxID=5936 RepID=A0AAD2CY93_EUPCR|nr:unnamed protein product [Moneuplotes crassus]
MGNNQPQNVWTYEEVSEKYEKAVTTRLEEEAQYKDYEGRRQYTQAYYKEYPEGKFTRNSTLNIDLDKQVHQYFIDYLGYKHLPSIYYLGVKGIHRNFMNKTVFSRFKKYHNRADRIKDNFDRFSNFTNHNFPREVEHLQLEGRNFDFSLFPEEQIQMISQKIKSSIHLKGFKMTTRDLQTVLNANHHLKRICVDSLKISDPDAELELQGSFRNIEEIILPKIGLSNRNIEHIVGHLIAKDEEFNNEIIPNIIRLNLYQKNDEQFLLDMKQKLQRKGFRGVFKTTRSDIALWRGIKRVLGFFWGIGKFMFRVTLFPFAYMYRMIQGH